MELVIALALLVYIAWRERAHAVERQALLSRRGNALPLPASSRQRRGGRSTVRVLSAEEDGAFNKKKEGEQAEEVED